MWHLSTGGVKLWESRSEFCLRTVADFIGDPSFTDPCSFPLDGHGGPASHQWKLWEATVGQYLFAQPEWSIRTPLFYTGDKRPGSICNLSMKLKGETLVFFFFQSDTQRLHMSVSKQVVFAEVLELVPEKHHLCCSDCNPSGVTQPRSLNVFLFTSNVAVKFLLLKYVSPEKSSLMSCFPSPCCKN